MARTWTPARIWTACPVLALCLLVGACAPGATHPDEAEMASASSSPGDGGSAGGLVLVRAPVDAGSSPDLDSKPEVGCEPGTLRCGPQGQRQVCNDDGDGWRTIAWCHAPTSCHPATVKCVQPICHPGAMRCTGQLQGQVCSDDGATWSDAFACTLPDRCSPQGCQTPVCTVGSTRCEGPALQVCSDAFTGWVPTSDTCVGALATSSCQQDATGSWSERTEPCPTGTSCLAGTCLPWICTPGEVRCVTGFTDFMQVCSATGRSWTVAPPSVACTADGTRLSCPFGELVEEACSAGTTCVDGQCLEPVCDPGAWRCTGAALERCRPDGQAWVSPGHGEVGCASSEVQLSCSGLSPTPTVTACSEAATCIPGAGCVATSCAPGAPRCTESGGLAYCSADGLYEIPGGCGTWTGCVEGDHEATCDCGDSPGCRALEGCVALRGGALPGDPLADGLRPVGAVHSLSTEGRHLVLGPVVDPRSGLALDLTDDMGAALTLRVDGQLVAAECKPPGQGEEVSVDVALLVDITQSMSGVRDALVAELADLRGALMQEHLDPVISVIPFGLTAPAPGATVLIPSLSGHQLTQAFEKWPVAAGGGASEAGLDAIQHAVELVPWRDGALSVVVVVTGSPLSDAAAGGPGETTLLEILDALVGRATVHVIGGAAGNHPFLAGGHPDPRLLACATGGTMEPISTHLELGAPDSALVRALRKTLQCTYDGPDSAHELTIEVGTELDGEWVSGDIEISVP